MVFQHFYMYQSVRTEHQHRAELSKCLKPFALGVTLGIFCKHRIGKQKHLGITISTKYAEKDGVGGFAPAKTNAAPSGLDPGGRIEPCSNPY